MTEESKPFEREDRYIVIKLKHMSPVQEISIRVHMKRLGIGAVQCCVIENDWPEYEAVWRMIEDRCAPVSDTTDRGDGRGVIQKLIDILTQHHQWHAAQTDTFEGDPCSPADAYAESQMCDRTIEALSKAHWLLTEGKQDLFDAAMSARPQTGEGE